MPPFDPGSVLPLNPRAFAILMALLEGPAHGYGLKTAVEARSGGGVVIDPGTLYRTVARLVDDGWAEPVPTPPDEEGEDSRRRYYAVTDRGRAVAAAEAQRLRSLLDRAESRHLLPDSG
ncbi:MAG: PadR family transcriptional regulator [Longimicrobiales bacterium]